MTDTHILDRDDAVIGRHGAIKLHGPEGFAGMRAAGRVAAEILDMLVPHVVPGVTTGELDDIVYAEMRARGAIPATLGYRGYTKSCCTSINHVVCHGIPGDRPLSDGDIVNIDVTPILDGWHGDTSRMYLVGDVPLKARRLVDVTYECLMLGIEQARPGNRLGDIAHAIQTHAEKHRYCVVRDFCGHGLGRVFHDAPEVVHAGRAGTGPELMPGMFFTIEPMINIGKADCKMLDDGWTAVTRDRSLSAQFEHSIGITETGCEIFTKSPKGLDRAALRLSLPRGAARTLLSGRARLKSAARIAGRRRDRRGMRGQNSHDADAVDKAGIVRCLEPWNVRQTESRLAVSRHRWCPATNRGPVLHDRSRLPSQAGHPCGSDRKREGSDLAR